MSNIEPQSQHLIKPEPIVAEFRLRHEIFYQYRIIAALVGFIIVLLLYGDRVRLDGSFSKNVALALLLSLIFIGLRTKFTKVVVTTEGIETYNWLGRLKFTVSFNELIKYGCRSRNDGYLVTADRKYNLPPIDFDDFHRLIVSRAPESLCTRIWTNELAPPMAEINEPIFDGFGWGCSIGFACAVTVILFLFTKNGGVLGATGYTFVSSIYSLKDIKSRLRMDSESISATSPRKCKSIKWSEVKAVFHVKADRRSCFVVTSETESIFIPAIIQANNLAMKKFFYSIPNGTLLVNFDDEPKKKSGG